jgi:hypothetical protein
MELFKITEEYDVELNKEWILLIPEFKALLQGDKGSPGDKDGRKKLKARKQFAYIYFMLDFKSPIESYAFAAKHKEALKYTGLEEKDVSDTKLRDAYDKYELLQIESARALKTLASVRKALDALDEYYNNVDFAQVDKQGKLLHNPKEVANSISTLNKMYDEVDKFENRVREQLRESTTIRGQASLGDKEHKKKGLITWEEESTPNETETNYQDLSVLLQDVKKPNE